MSAKKGPAEISVITITWNNLPGLMHTLESVQNQTFGAVQHIVIDGSSSDGTQDFLRQYSPRKPFIAISEPDDGIYDAMNKGARNSEGAYLMFMNAGDAFAASSTLEELAELLNKVTPMWAFGSSEMHVGDRSTGIHRLPPFAKLRLFTGIATVPHQASVVSRELWDRLGGFRTDVGFSADQEFMMRAWMTSPPLVVDSVIARCDDTGISSRNAVGEWARQAARHRATIPVPILCSPPLNYAVRVGGELFDRARVAVRSSKLRG